MPMVWSALKEDHSRSSSLANICLGIANGYGSTPHRLLFFALERYGIDPHWISFIKMYNTFSGIYSRSSSQSAPSSWQQHFRGIFAGCTLSIILFLAGTNVYLQVVLLYFQLNHDTKSSTPLIPLVQWWSPLISEILISLASFLEKKISKYIRKWLTIHSPITDLSFYSLISPWPLLIKCRTSILISSEISRYLLIQDSKDPLVSLVSPNLKSGHWKATSALQITEAELIFHKIKGLLHLGRSGPENVKPTPVLEKGS